MPAINWAVVRDVRNETTSESASHFISVLEVDSTDQVVLNLSKEYLEFTLNSRE